MDDSIASTLTLWNGISSRFPDLGSPFSRHDQQEREARLEGCLAELDSEPLIAPRTPKEAEKILHRITSMMVRISVQALEVDDPQISGLLQDGFSHVGLDLARRARRLDPAVRMIDVLQAARNAWTACGLQVLLGRRMHLTSSIFAYSMLYPYSDNYLDDPTVPNLAKSSFNERFRLRLAGHPLAAANDRERIIWQLVRLIESEYSRGKFPQVYQSLLAIQHAQENSLQQTEKGREIDVARLTVAKGGTSVLADAYLAAGNLTAAQAKFAFQWGVVLQIGDDLQDLVSDRRRGSLTIFTQAAQHQTLDDLANRAFTFSARVMSGMQILPNQSRNLHSLLARSSHLLLIRSIANAPGHFSRDYLEQLESYSPLSFNFLRKREKSFAARRRSYAMMFEQIINVGLEFNERETLLSTTA